MENRYAYSSVLLLLVASCLCRAETLQELLVSNHVPLASFRPSDLQQTVQGAAATDEQQVVLAYQLVKGNSLLGNPHLVQYSKTSGNISHFEPPVDHADLCSGSIWDIQFIGEFTLLSTSISPSAECMFVFDANLAPRQTLFGFGPIVDSHLIVLIENMIHFAPVHPERLQAADLVNGKTVELYPPKGDVLRNRLITEHEKHMPSEAICARNNDPCEPDKFDEDIRSLQTNGNGSLAFLVMQSGSHAFKPDTVPVTVASQSVFYIYKRDPAGWRYCEQEISPSQVETLDQTLHSDFAQVAARCTPTEPVLPDMSTADYNPFSER